MRLIQQSQTAQPLLFLMVLSSDHVTPATGLAPVVTLSKSGGSFAAAAGSVSEIANGWYKVAGNATDTATLGPLILHATGTASDSTDVYFDVVSFNPQDAVRLGLTALPNTACSTNASLLTSGTGTDQLSVSSGVAQANLAQILGTALTESAGYLAGGFKKFFNIQTPTLTTGGVDQTGDSYARLGIAGAGITALGDVRIAHLDADVSSRSTFAGGAVASVTGNVGGNVLGSVASVTAAVTLPTIPTDWIAAAGVKADAVTKIQSGLMLASSYTAAPSAAAIDTQLSGTHGSGAWGASGSGSGAYAVTVTVTDGASPVQSALVRLGNGVDQFTASTDASGAATFSLDSATYTVGITRGGYQFTPTTLVVSGVTSRTFAMTATVIAPPDDPELCAVQGYLISGNGAVAANVPVLFTLSGSGPAITLSGQAVTRGQVSVLTDSDGKVSVNLVRTDQISGSSWSWTVTCQAAFSKSITLTDSTYNLTPAA